MTEITLDKSDPAVSGLIGDWQDGQTYSLELKQVKTQGSKVTFQVDDKTEYDQEPDAGDTSDDETAEPGESAGPVKHKNPALMVLIGNHK